MDTLAQLLEQNQGNALTPELSQQIMRAVPLMAFGDTQLDLPFAKYNLERKRDPRLVLDQSQRINQWVARMTNSCPWANAYAMGLINDDDEVVAGVVLENYNRASANIHVAGIGRHWLSPCFLFAVFDYAFNQLELKRLHGWVAESNQDALRFDLHLGFKVEHVLEDAHPDGKVYLLVMRPEDCRFIANANKT